MVKTVKKEKTETVDVSSMIDELATKANVALKAMEDFTQEQVDHIVHQMAMAALDQHMPLAKMAVEETGRGIYEDKAIKNMYASEYIWNNIKHDKTVGVINKDEQTGLMEQEIQLFLLSILAHKNVRQKRHVLYGMRRLQQVHQKIVFNGLNNHRLMQHLL